MMDKKDAALTVKLQPDLMKWLKEQATLRRATMAYIVRDLINDAVIASRQKRKEETA